MWRLVEFFVGNRCSIKEEEDYVCVLDDVEKVKVDMCIVLKDFGEEVSDVV